MGYEYVELKVTGRVSRHNSERDDEHDKLWEEFCEQVNNLLDSGYYDDISPMVM